MLMGVDDTITTSRSHLDPHFVYYRVQQLVRDALDRYRRTFSRTSLTRVVDIPFDHEAT